MSGKIIFITNSDDRLAVRRALLSAGIKTHGMDDDALMAAYNEIHGHDQDGSEAPSEAPKPAPTPTPAPAPKAREAGIQGAVAALVAELEATRAATVDEDAVLAIVHREIRALSVPRSVRVTIERKDCEPVELEGCQHYMLPTLLAFIEAGEDVAAVGPAGSGKSTMFKQIAEALGLRYSFVGSVSQEHKVLGFIDAAGTYHRTPFREAYENGGLFVFEEFDGSSEKALLAINNALAGADADFPDGMVKRHDSFVCVMAGNTYGTGASREYVGRRQLDGATLDRFAFVEIPYDEALEREAALAHWDGADAWVSLVQATRHKAAELGIRAIISPRASIKGAKVLKHGRASVETVTAAYLYKGLPADAVAQLKECAK